MISSHKCNDWPFHCTNHQNMLYYILLQNVVMLFMYNNTYCQMDLPIMWIVMVTDYFALKVICTAGLKYVSIIAIIMIGK